jgi:hypothetical protein
MELAIVLVSVAVPVILTLVTLRRQLQTVMGVVSGGPPEATPILLRFVGEELRELESRVSEVKTTGTLLNQSMASHWVRRRCFAGTTGRHVAADASVPSEFLRHYRDYLQAQDLYVRRTRRRDATRINISDDAALARDAQAHPEAFAEYVNWHREHHVALLHVPSQRALHLAQLNRLEDRTEIGAWVGEVALVWENVPEGIRVRLAFVGETLYDRCVEYLEAVLAEAKRFPAFGLETGADLPAVHDR